MNEIRLIDANALKYKTLAEVNGKLTHVLTAEEIDNAPTVEPEVYMTAKDYNLYLEGYKQGRKDFGRQTGKWIIDGHHIRCNRCNEYICNTDNEGNKIPDNYCPNCGAEMRGDEE